REAENAKFLSDMQSKLRDQAKSLATRMRSREVGATNPAFQRFAEDMDKAVEAMSAASDKLRGRQWQPALPPEEKALQYISRAEA
ncbi:hypothetical protein, partial [Citrobacter braakii]|uniref:hypothetical protein n=1 Tax=Citrobacter braakii TaxID=57706 RepID=UPI0039B5865B